MLVTKSKDYKTCKRTPGRRVYDTPKIEEKGKMGYATFFYNNYAQYATPIAMTLDIIPESSQYGIQKYFNYLNERVSDMTLNRYGITESKKWDKNNDRRKKYSGIIDVDRREGCFQKLRKYRGYLLARKAIAKEFLPLLDEFENKVEKLPNSVYRKTIESKIKELRTFWKNSLTDKTYQKKNTGAPTLDLEGFLQYAA